MSATVNAGSQAAIPCFIPSRIRNMAAQIDSRLKPLWQYGLFSVNSELLVRRNLGIRQGSGRKQLMIAGDPVDLEDVQQILVVGAGKAGAGMVRGLRQALAQLDYPIRGWVNVPDNCVEPAGDIVLHPGRPAARNEPVQAGVIGAQKMMELVQSAGPKDLAICLVSGGGSALAPLPVDGVPLQDKLEMTRFLSRAGATINELNAVRSTISQIKGGGLVRRFRGHSFHSLIISDVPGNPLEVIASGMTIPQTLDYDRAIAVLEKFDPHQRSVPPSIWAHLRRQADRVQSDASPLPPNRIHNAIIGDNATAINSIAAMARNLGFETEAYSQDRSEGDVTHVADKLWQHVCQLSQNRDRSRPFLFLSGGEPTVNVGSSSGKGGRNQHLVLAMTAKWLASDEPLPTDLEIVSLGTDGEDGPTDAAGAFVNQQIIDRIREMELDPAIALNRFDAYPFLDQVGALIRTGPTNTNVCDIRLISFGQPENGLASPPET